MRTGTFTPLPVVAVRTRTREEWLAPRGLWFPAAAMAASLVVAATAGITFGVLAALDTGVARERWPATVQAHGGLQLWGWFAVFIVTLLFEFIVRFNGRPSVPLLPRATVLLLLGGGGVLSTAGRFLDVASGLIIVGSASTASGALMLAALVMRIPPAHPYRVDLHPVFFRAGAVWLLLAALASLVASRATESGASSLDEGHLVAELFLRGFVMNVTFAVALRAFVGHLGLPPMTVGRQRVLWVLMNASIVVWVSGSAGFGLPGATSLVAMGDLVFATAMLLGTWALGIGRAVRSWRQPVHRAQVLVPVAWIGLVVYSFTLAAQAGMVLAADVSLTLYAVGATRHLLALGFVAPLLIAMAHVVLERFLIGRLFGQAWLTAAFVMLVVAWPLRAFPPLVDDSVGNVARGLMGTAGVLTSGALLIAAIVTTWNALAADRYVRLLQTLEGERPKRTLQVTERPFNSGAGNEGTHMHEIDVRSDIAAGREPFPRIMAAVKALAPGSELRLIAPFEPQPLYAVLAAQGFEHETVAAGDDAWHVTIRRSSGRA